MKTITNYLNCTFATITSLALLVGLGCDVDQGGSSGGGGDGGGDGGGAKQKIGETVKFEDSEWVVREAKDLGSSLKSGNQFTEDLTSDAGTYVQVEFSVKNTTNEEEQILNTPNLKADGGASYEQLSSSSSYIPEGKNTMTLEALPAGLPKVFYAIYEVPKDAVKGLSFEARELAGSLFEEPTTKLVDLALGGGSEEPAKGAAPSKEPAPEEEK